MTVEDVIAKRVDEIGITAAELARRCGLDAVLLRRSLNGKRRISSKELVALANQLNLTLDEFAECD